MTRLSSIKTKGIIAFAVFSVFFSCKVAIPSDHAGIPEREGHPISVRDYSIAAVLWQQRSAEYRALAYQAFNIARMQLDRHLTANRESKKTLAIITDIDETILDNSPYSGKQIELDEDYTTSRWDEWVNLKSAKAIPGSLEFFHYAASKGVEVFYITNRDQHQKEATLENLKAVGFPFADDRHILLRGEDSGKETRRKKVEASYEIVMLIGDNLSDFSYLFEKRSAEERNKSADNLKMLFGTKYIVLPNPIYGDWETQGIFEGKHNWTEFQKDSLRHKKIIAY